MDFLIADLIVLGCNIVVLGCAVKLYSEATKTHIFTKSEKKGL